MSLQAEFFEVASAGGRAALVTVVEAGEAATVGGKLLVRADGTASGSLGSTALDADARESAQRLMWEEHSALCTFDAATVFVDVTAPPPRLVMFGAIDFAGPLARVARIAGWRPFVVDPRSRFADPARFPDAERVIARWPREAVRDIGGLDRATYVAVITHDPKLDDAALSIALDSKAPYIGAMGSRRAQADRRERLLRLGYGDEQLARIAAPIGLDLGALSPEETAVSIVAELIAVRRGRDGGRLSAASGRIHGAHGGGDEALATGAPAR